jgi:aldose 1-epimerase
MASRNCAGAMEDNQVSNQGIAEQPDVGGLRISEQLLGSSVGLEVSGPTSRVTLSTRGATLLRWTERDAADEEFELVDGYASGEEMSGQDGMRSAIMVPFSNRIEGGTYTWEGREIDLSSRSGAPVIHGLLRDQVFDIRRADVVGSTAVVTFTSRGLRPGRWPGYPFAVDVGIEYRISPRRLTVTISAVNVGHTSAPFCSGWHPYFSLGDVPADELVLRVPAASRIVTDESLIPVPGPAAFADIVSGGPWDFRLGSRIGDRVIDTCFTKLARDGNGRLATSLADEAHGRSISVWQDRGHVHLYTADGLKRTPRRSVAIEPVEALTNAFNRPDQVEAILLAPGATRYFTFGAVADLGVM